MAKAYQYYASGYYAGEIEDFGRLPSNATRTAPELQDGFIPRWTGEAWEQVENHLGKEGYVNGEAFTIKEYGTLPEGWSDTPPEPTQEEKYNQEREAILAQYEATLKTIKENIATINYLPMQDTTTLETLQKEYQSCLDKRKVELDTLDTKYGIAS